MGSIKVGVVGLGWAASGHLPAFKANSNIEVVALCSSKDLSAEQIRGMCGSDAALYHDYEDFLEHPRRNTRGYAGHRSGLRKRNEPNNNPPKVAGDRRMLCPNGRI